MVHFIYTIGNLGRTSTSYVAVCSLVPYQWILDSQSSINSCLPLQPFIQQTRKPIKENFMQICVDILLFIAFDVGYQFLGLFWFKLVFLLRQPLFYFLFRWIPPHSFSSPCNTKPLGPMKGTMCWLFRVFPLFLLGGLRPMVHQAWQTKTLIHWHIQCLF